MWAEQAYSDLVFPQITFSIKHQMHVKCLDVYINTAGQSF